MQCSKPGMLKGYHLSMEDTIQYNTIRYKRGTFSVKSGVCKIKVGPQR